MLLISSFIDTAPVGKMDEFQWVPIKTSSI